MKWLDHTRWLALKFIMTKRATEFNEIKQELRNQGLTGKMAYTRGEVLLRRRFHDEYRAQLKLMREVVDTTDVTL